MSGENKNFPFPLVYGNELETSVNFFVKKRAEDTLTGFVEETTSVIEPPASHYSGLSTSPPNELLTGSEFLNNGFRYYDGSLKNASGSEKVEVATPETLNPTELIVYMRAGELILQNSVKEFLLGNSYDGEITKARIQRRNVDSYLHSWGCHDNYGYDKKDYKVFREMDHPELFDYFLITRTILTGAGLMTKGGYKLSQKAETFDELSKYGFNSRLRRFTANLSEDSGRVEVSCSDYNNLDWAALMRIGGFALLTASELVGGNENLKDMASGRVGRDIFAQAKQINHVNADKDGRITLSQAQLEAVDFQKRFLNCATDRLESVGVKIPKIYSYIAKESLKLLDEITSSAEEINVFNIADRPEWASRLATIILKIQKDESAGTVRFIGDNKSLAADLSYDSTVMSVFDKRVFIDEGKVDKIKKRGLVEVIADTSKIKTAYSTPPKSRAEARTSIMQLGKVKQVDWHEVNVLLPSGETRSYRLSDVLECDASKIHNDTV